MKIKIFDSWKEADKNGGQLLVRKGETHMSEWIGEKWPRIIENHTDRDLFVGFQHEEPVITETIHMEHSSK